MKEGIPILKQAIVALAPSSRPAGHDPAPAGAGTQSGLRRRRVPEFRRADLVDPVTVRQPPNILVRGDHCFTPRTYLAGRVSLVRFGVQIPKLTVFSLQLLDLWLGARLW
jgi:hypothetical protein